MPAFDPYHTWLGIPPHESAAGALNHYRLLGLNLFEANAEVINSAADSRMAHLRAAQIGRYSKESQKLLNQVASAKRCLLSPENKAAYDAELRSKLAAAQPVGNGLRAVPGEPVGHGTPRSAFPTEAPQPQSPSTNVRPAPLRIAARLTAAELGGGLLLGRVAHQPVQGPRRMESTWDPSASMRLASAQPHTAA